MIYLDTSVVLAHLLAEDREVDPTLWAESLVSSRLLQYEAWTRLHARGLDATHGALLEELLSRVAFLELAPPVLARALEPFPVPVRTLDALHLASVAFLTERTADVALATLDERLADAARRLAMQLVTV